MTVEDGLCGWESDDKESADSGRKKIIGDIIFGSFRKLSHDRKQVLSSSQNLNKILLKTTTCFFPLIIILRNKLRRSAVEIVNNKEINAYLKKGDANLGTMGFCT